MVCNLKCFIAALFVFLLFTVFCGCTQSQQDSGASPGIKSAAPSSVSNDRVGPDRIISSAENLRNDKPRQRHAIKKADKEKGGESHASQDDVVISESGHGIAYVASKDGSQFVVHNGKSGIPYSEIQHLRISPDGKRVAYSKSVGTFFQMVTDDIAGKLNIDVYDPIFSPDSHHIAYLAEGLDRAMNIVLDGKIIDSQNNVVSAEFLFSGDSSKLVYHVRPFGNGTTAAELVIYDLKSGKKTTKQCLDIPLCINSNKTRIAAVTKTASGDKHQVIDFSLDSTASVRTSVEYDVIALLSFSSDGKSLSYVAVKGNHQYLVLNGKEFQLPDKLAVAAPPVFHPVLNSVGVILKTTERDNNQYYLYESSTSANSALLQSRLIRELTYGVKKDDIAFVSTKNDGFMMVVNGKEGPLFDSVVSPLFSADGRKLLYRAREGVNRFVVVVDLATHEHHRQSPFEMVFPVNVAADSKSFAYGVKANDNFIWKVEKL
jgi:Tol biopolymer transport system component